MVNRFCHSHRDGHPLVAMPLTKPSLTPPLDHLQGTKNQHNASTCLSLEGGGGGGGGGSGVVVVRVPTGTSRCFVVVTSRGVVAVVFNTIT